MFNFGRCSISKCMAASTHGVLSALQTLPREAVWPWVADNMDVLDEALGLKPTARPIPTDRALEALSLLPVIPQRYFAECSAPSPYRKNARCGGEPWPSCATAKALSSGSRRLLATTSASRSGSTSQSWRADLRSIASEGALAQATQEGEERSGSRRSDRKPATHGL